MNNRSLVDVNTGNVWVWFREDGSFVNVPQELWKTVGEWTQDEVTELLGAEPVVAQPEVVVEEAVNTPIEINFTNTEN